MALSVVKRRDGELEDPGIARLHRDMDDLFHGFFSDWNMPLWTDSQWPVIDIYEGSDKSVLKVEVPGCKADDIDISVQSNTLIITGEEKEEQTDNAKNYYYSERTFGCFRRDLNLTRGVRADKITVSYTNGVLTVTAPKTEKNKPVMVKIKEVSASKVPPGNERL